MNCLPTCRPARPCCVRGCPYYGEVQIGSGGYAGQDMNDLTYNNGVYGGAGRTRIAVDGYAGRDSNNIVRNNRIADAYGDVDVAARNYAGNDSNMDVYGINVRGTARGTRVRVAADNGATYGNNNMRVACNDIDDAYGDVDMAVGNWAGRNNNMDMVNNRVRGARGGVGMGVGNRAGRDNNAGLYNNEVYRN